MASIPVLNDRQMNALRRLTGTSRKFNLVPTAKAKTRNLPSYEEEVNAEIAYNGYFTLKTRLDGETQKIVVCDGATYDPQTGTSGVSVCKVNNLNYDVPCTTITPETGNKKIILVFVPEQGSYHVVIEIVDDIIHDDRPIYLIGEYIFSNGQLKIIQRHGMTMGNNFSNGFAYIQYFETCYGIV